MAVQGIFFRTPGGGARRLPEVPATGLSAANASPAPFFREPEALAAETRQPAPEAGIRVLHVFKTNYLEQTGGIENAMRQMVTAAAPLGIESTILCMDGSREKAPGGEGGKSEGACEGFPPCGYTPRVVSCRPLLRYDSLSFSRAMFSRFSSLLREHDLVHYHFPFPQQDIMHLWAKPDVPAVLTYHSDIVRQRFLFRIYRPLLRGFLSRVDAIVATSENYLDSSAVLKYYKNKVSVIPLGLDPDSYPAADAGLLRKWEAAAGRGFFLFVGVLRYYKGLDILLAAAARTSRRFVIAGAGPMQARLRRTAARMGLSNVIFAGSISEADKAALLVLCRALVFPSHLRSEAFGLALVEGAMYGRPLISCDIGTGTSFVNDHGKTGLVVRRGCPDALAEAVETLARDDTLAASFGKSARRRFRELFTARMQAEKYAALYGRLLGVPLEHARQQGCYSKGCPEKNDCIAKSPETSATGNR